MLRIVTFLCIIIGISCTAKKPIHKAFQPPITSFEADENTSADYFEAIAYYEALASAYPDNVNIRAVGRTDSGYPLHEVTIYKDGTNTPAKTRSAGKVSLMVNNAIHPGEPCGIDASMLMAKELVTEKQNLLNHTTVIIIPVYNIGGALNRGSSSRANQNGPVAYGFRGNAKNLDLNRDFIKTDSENAKAFTTIFNHWSPQILVDNHTSNGADYQYVMTLIPTQKDKLNATLSTYLTENMIPDLYKKMESKNYGMIPYVYSIAGTPDKGIAGFMDHGRYSSGYAALHHTLSFMPETHMLKPYKDRVWSTFRFFESMLEHIASNHKMIIQNQRAAVAASLQQTQWPLQWAIDTTSVDSVLFRGYEAAYKPSEITGSDRLYYDRDKPYSKYIKHYNTYTPSLTVTAPRAYIIPQGYTDVISRLKANGVAMEPLLEDEIKTVEVYYIEDYTSSPRPYEGHYLHREVEVRAETQEIAYRKGDMIASTDQAAKQYIIQVLEPQAPDSYFAWNFFDGILMQKEYFSPYVFEDLAVTLLESDKELKSAFEMLKTTDETFASDSRAQLEYIYKHSPYYEPTYLRFPIARIR